MADLAVTADAVTSDVLKWESDFRYCREEKVVAESQTLVVGSCCRADGNGRQAAVAANVNEVQTLAITGTLTAGTFTLRIIDYLGVTRVTPPIAFNANTAAIQAALDDALGANAIVAGGTAITASTLTFSGTNYAGKKQSLIEVDTSGLTGEDDASVTRTTAGTSVEAVCLQNITTGASETTTKAVFLIRGPAVVSSANLAYGTATKAIIEASLLSLGIVARAA